VISVAGWTMRIWLRGGLVVAFLALAGCSKGEDELYYDIAPDDAFARLIKADITGFRDARQCGMLIYFEPKEYDDTRTIVWEVTSGDRPVARFGLHVIAKGSGSVIEMQIPKAPDGKEIYDGTQKYSHPAFLQPVRPALRELVDAAMERRPYDWHRISDMGVDYTICGSMRQNFIASGQPYRIDDPSGMTHEQAEAVRSKYNSGLPVERDDVFAPVGR